jgi:hypothetical protein
MREVAGSNPGLDFYTLCEPIYVSLRLFTVHVHTNYPVGELRVWEKVIIKEKFNPHDVLNYAGVYRASFGCQDLEIPLLIAVL